MGNMGYADYKRWQNGERLTKQRQINALCYECNGFEDSGNDCLGEKSCPMYPYSPSAQRRGFTGGVVPAKSKPRAFAKPIKPVEVENGDTKG